MYYNALSNPQASKVVEGRLMSVDINGEINEQRSSVRYDVNGTVSVIAYLFEGKAYNLHTPQDAGLINISKGGVRLRMKPNSLSVDDIVHITLQIGDKQRILNAHVVNLNNTEENSEYGCMLVS